MVGCVPKGVDGRALRRGVDLRVKFRWPCVYACFANAAPTRESRWEVQRRVRGWVKGFEQAEKVDKKASTNKDGDGYRSGDRVCVRGK